MMTARLLGCEDFPGEASAVASVRRWVRTVLDDDHPRLDDVVLLIDEVFTNSIRHSDSRHPGETITVTLIQDDQVMRGEVIDAGSASSEPHAQGDLYAETGRGMWIVKDVTNGRWGFYDDPAGRATWFEVQLP